MSIKTKNQHRKAQQNMAVYSAISQSIYPHGEVMDWDITELHKHMREMIRAIYELDISQKQDRARIASRILAMGWHRKKVSVRIVQEIVETLNDRLIARQSPLVAAVRSQINNERVN